MIKKEITTIAEVWQIHGVFAVFILVSYFYSSHFAFFLVPMAGLGLFGLITLLVKKHVNDKLVGVKILQGFSGLIQAIVCAFAFALFRCNDTFSFFSFFVPMLLLIAFIVVLVNLLYPKLDKWEKSSTRKKFTLIFISVLIPVFICIRTYTSVEFLHGLQIFSFVMTIFQSILTGYFSRAKRYAFEDKNKETEKTNQGDGSMS